LLLYYYYLVDVVFLNLPVILIVIIIVFYFVQFVFVFGLRLSVFSSTGFRYRSVLALLHSSSLLRTPTNVIRAFFVAIVCITTITLLNRCREWLLSCCAGNSMLVPITAFFLVRPLLLDFLKLVLFEFFRDHSRAPRHQVSTYLSVHGQTWSETAIGCNALGLWYLYNDFLT